MGKRDLVRAVAAARGEERLDSDLNFLVEPEPDRSLPDLIGLENDLADALGRAW
ncbi:MAG: hypothetical protein M0015_13515 [Betaproteobacteria bacterium]|nr:hypothetical protein [Betaproteobacteria bacterium]